VTKTSTAATAQHDPNVALYEFMPYGAPELLEASRPYMSRAIMTSIVGYIALCLVSFGGFLLMKRAPKETSVIVVPYREIAAPPPLTNDAPPPQVAITTAVTPPTVGVAVPVPDAEAPPEQTIASQEEISAQTQSAPTTNDGDNIVVQPPSEDELPKLGEYVYFEEMPEAITKGQPQYPDIAREAGVDGTVVVQALVGKDGKVKDTRVTKSIPMLDAAAVSSVRGWVFKPALSNNKPVAVWVAIPVRFSLH
jgi:periplasmic protein TonB